MHYNLFVHDMPVTYDEMRKAAVIQANAIYLITPAVLDEHSQSVFDAQAIIMKNLREHFKEFCQ